MRSRSIHENAEEKIKVGGDESALSSQYLSRPEGRTKLRDRRATNEARRDQAESDKHVAVIGLPG
jgi:hypothetical protein